LFGIDTFILQVYAVAVALAVDGDDRGQRGVILPFGRDGQQINKNIFVEITDEGHVSVDGIIFA
jgi:hypothetical protein